MEEDKSIHAKYVMTIFRNDTTGFSVAKFRMYDVTEKEFIATGIFSELHEDVIYTLYGGFEEHMKYGMQFKVSGYEKMKPNDRDSLIRYFSSALFSGIGKKTAAAIVDELGSEAIDLIREDETVLNQIEGLSEKRKFNVIQGIHQSDDNDDSVSFFTRYGISVRNIMKIESAYGEEAIRKVKENPYQLVEDIDGIGFKTADKVAREFHFEEDHPYRIRAMVLSAVLESCMASGNSYVTIDQLKRNMHKKLSIDIDLDFYLQELMMDRMVVMEEERIYHHTQYDAEKGIAQFLSGFPYTDQDMEHVKKLKKEIKNLEDEFHITYEKKQIQAMEEFFENPFLILTGGPGTGKTTIVKGIISLYHTFYPQMRITCCAPTGRAAKRLAELSDGAATTIHSLLKWDLESNTFKVDDTDPIQTDLLIIDEFSMVDAWLFYHLLRASKEISKILIIGDEDQLPSVGPGSVLHDLIASAYFPVVRLDKIFRQSEGSDVVALAHEIRAGTCDTLDHAKDVAFFECTNTDVKDIILSIVQTAFDKGYQDKDIQVLAPMYHGVAGIDTLNNVLQKMMNPSASYKRELMVGYRTFREDDKVLQLKNQPEDDVYNGDIGKIIEIIYASEDVSKLNRIIVDFDGIIVEYSGEQIQNITHAYCISIHKSQGSEYPIVIIPVLFDYHHMLQRRLLYTGITRAKNSLILLGQHDAFVKGIVTKDRSVRKTTLIYRLQQELE